MSTDRIFNADDGILFGELTDPPKGVRVEVDAELLVTITKLVRRKYELLAELDAALTKMIGD